VVEWPCCDEERVLDCVDRTGKVCRADILHEAWRRVAAPGKSGAVVVSPHDAFESFEIPPWIFDKSQRAAVSAS
jgi:hypothetical protein